MEIPGQISAEIDIGMIEPNTAWSAACKSELR
jgi:hypothetical protein